MKIWYESHEGWRALVTQRPDGEWEYFDPVKNRTTILLYSVMEKDPEGKYEWDYTDEETGEYEYWRFNYRPYTPDELVSSPGFVCEID